MKMQDVLPKMSKLYLNRVVGSFLKDVRLDDEVEMREVILKNIKEFKNEERVMHNLDFAEDPRDVDVLSELILICLIQADDYLLSGADLIKALMHREQQIVSDSEDDEYVQTAIPNFAYRVYKPVIEAAWKKDESLNAHE